MRHFFTPDEQTINGICIHCNILLNDNKSIPQTVFYQQQQKENSLVAENKFNPIHGRPCVHPGIKFKVLIAYFVEINEQSHSFPQLTIKKQTKQKHSLVYFLLIIFFSCKEIRY